MAKYTSMLPESSDRCNAVAKRTFTRVAWSRYPTILPVAHVTTGPSWGSRPGLLLDFWTNPSGYRKQEKVKNVNPFLFPERMIFHAFISFQRRFVVETCVPRQFLSFTQSAECGTQMDTVCCSHAPNYLLSYANSRRNRSSFPEIPHIFVSNLLVFWKLPTPVWVALRQTKQYRKANRNVIFFSVSALLLCIQSDTSAGRVEGFAA